MTKFDELVTAITAYETERAEWRTAVHNQLVDFDRRLIALEGTPIPDPIPVPIPVPDAIVGYGRNNHDAFEEVAPFGGAIDEMAVLAALDSKRSVRIAAGALLTTTRTLWVREDSQLIFEPGASLFAAHGGNFIALDGRNCRVQMLGLGGRIDGAHRDGAHPISIQSSSTRRVTDFWIDGLNIAPGCDDIQIWAWPASINAAGE
ncbi:MAG: hypothetical protein NUW01_18160, partial [Gemmatimonadaceae bacterium]|nr:hypothetical protein [Gemmatimonadaceae bacterium]